MANFNRVVFALGGGEAPPPPPDAAALAQDNNAVKMAAVIADSTMESITSDAQLIGASREQMAITELKNASDKLFVTYKRGMINPQHPSNLTWLGEDHNLPIAVAILPADIARELNTVTAHPMQSGQLRAHVLRCIRICFRCIHTQQFM